MDQTAGTDVGGEGKGNGGRVDNDVEDDRKMARQRTHGYERGLKAMEVPHRRKNRDSKELEVMESMNQ
jgi:hypothetical protein